MPHQEKRPFSRMRSILIPVLALISCAGAQAGSEADLIVFGTSASGNGILGAWDEAGGEVGVAAADNICQARAQAAGLANYQNFVAWISDSTSDAYCRMNLLTGKISDNCGLGALPLGVGPWVRTDGFAFALHTDQMVSPADVVYTPLRYDELGEPLPANAFFWTGTLPDGSWSGKSNDCSGWTSASGRATGGLSGRTAQGWTAGTLPFCSNSAHLICFQVGDGPELPPFNFEGRIAFVSNYGGNGNFGDSMAWPDNDGQMGVQAADAVCQAQAANAGLSSPTSYKAWLSDDGSGIDAVDRFDNDGRWIRLDGVPIAENLADLSDGELFAPINLTPSGTYLGNFGVWTGTTNDGIASAVDCQSWSSSDGADLGTAGFANAADIWTDNGLSTACSFGGARIYCLSDVPFLDYAEGFESLPP